MSDVARAAGVSTMTVSRVLNSSATVLEDTRQRVFAAIDALGYRPNELARSLRARRSRQIGILVPNLYDPFFATCAHVVNTVAHSNNYSVCIAMTAEDPAREFEEAGRMLRRSVEGLVVVPVAVSGRSRLLAAEFGSLPMATIDRPAGQGGQELDTFVVRNREGACEGTHHLLALGHSRVACIALSRRLFTMGMRLDGYREAMEQSGNVPHEVIVPEDAEGTLAELRRLLAAPDAPTALFCANNLTTRNVLHSLQQMHLHPPSPVALVGFDDFETADLLRPGVTVVRQPVEAMAQAAAEALFDRLLATGPPAPPRHITLPVHLVVRGSCGAKLPDMSPGD